MTKPADHDLALRIVRAAGFDEEQFAAKASDNLAMLQDKHVAELATDPSTEPLTPQEIWLVNSGAQLHRWFGGRCISCANWTASKDGSGTCAALGDYLGGKKSVPTMAAFGCTLFDEIPAEDTPTIRTRTELAIGIGLLDAYPEPSGD